MDIIKKITQLKQKVKETDLLVDKLLSKLEDEKMQSKINKDSLNLLKDEVKSSVNKIDKIVKDYNANS